MKYNYLFVLVTLVAFVASCQSEGFKKKKSGLEYKVIAKGSSKDSISRENDVLKFHVITKINDSVLFTSYGKMPQYGKVPPDTLNIYSPVEAFAGLRKGDSLITVSNYDSLVKKGMSNGLPPAKKGSKITTTFKILEVFKTDSVARADFDAEMAKDAPRQQKEQEEALVKRKEEIKKMIAAEEEELRKSGEIDKEIKEMEAFLASKNIKAQRTGKGTYVVIKSAGTGAQVENGDTITVKYDGRKMLTDSSFQANSYTFPVGENQVIQGWDEGLLLFKQGGKGVLYVPGFLAYGKNGEPNFKPFEALKFDVEIVDVKKKK